MACVLGEVDLLRALALAGIRCAVVARKTNPAHHSRAAAVVLERIDPLQRPEAAVEALVRFAREQPEPPVLFYDADFDLLLVSRHREELGRHFRFVVPDRDLVEQLVDKALFRELAEHLELPVPRSRKLPAGGVDPEGLDLRYPLVVKPLTRDHETWKPLSRAKAMSVESAEALRRLQRQFGDQDLEVIVQEAVPGPESLVESYHVYVDEGEDIAAEFTGRKLRTHPRVYGYSTALVITDSREVRDLGRQLTRRLGLRGVAKMDFKRGPGGELMLLEVNPRFTLWHHPAALGGINIPAFVYSDLVGLPRPAGGTLRAGVRWCNPVRDPRAARSEGISGLRWAWWALSCEAKSGFAWDDPLPLAIAAGWRVRQRLLGSAATDDREE